MQIRQTANKMEISLLQKICVEYHQKNVGTIPTTNSMEASERPIIPYIGSIGVRWYGKYISTSKSNYRPII